MHVLLNTLLVATDLVFDVPKKRTTVAGVAHTNWSFADIARQVQVVLFAIAERFFGQRLQLGRRKRLGIGKVVASVRRPVLRVHIVLGLVRRTGLRLRSGTIGQRLLCRVIGFGPIV